MKNDMTVVWLAVVSFVGALLVYVMTGPFGVGLSADSVTWIQAAKSLTLGHGLAAYNNSGRLAPLVLPAPGFAPVLGSAWFLGLNFFEWVRLINTFCYGGLLLLTGLAVRQVTRDTRSVFLSVGLVFVTVQILELQGRLLAAPLFLFLTALFFWAWSVFVDTNDRRAFYTAAVAAGLAPVMDHAGIAWVIAGIWWLVARPREGRRAGDVFCFAAVAGVLPLMELTRRLVVTGGIHHLSPPTWNRIFVFIDSLSRWFVPARVPDLLRWVVLGLAVGVALGVMRGRRVKTSGSVTGTVVFWGGAVLIYLVVAWIGAVTGCGSTVMDHRVLAPVFLLAAMVLGALVTGTTDLPAAGQKALLAALVLFAGLGLARDGQLVVSLYRNGYGYSAREIEHSKLAEVLRSLDDQVPLYSNDPQALYYFSGRPSIKIPLASEKGRWLPSPAQITADFKERRAVAVVFGNGAWRASSAWAQAAAGIPLSALMKDPSGTIYGFRKK